MKLNIGDAGQSAEGYIGIDISRGQDATLLPYEDGSIEEIRASHVLEHFGHDQILPTLKEWIRTLKPGGVLKIGVPDFKELAEHYLAGAHIQIQRYIMGGQMDPHDYHKTIFDYELLTETLKQVGLIGIRRWKDDIEDSSHYPFSILVESLWHEAACRLAEDRSGDQLAAARLQ
jgi:predicted SAM-dependent methyltransferase